MSSNSERKITKNVKEAYKLIAKRYNRTVKSEEHDRRFIEKFLSRFKAGQKVLDVGVGTGSEMHEMQQAHHLRVTGIDISSSMIRIAHKEHPELRISLMDVRRLRFPSSYFDGAYAGYSLIHLPEEDIPRALRQIARVLKTGGLLYLALQEPITTKQIDAYYPVVYYKKVKMFINLIKENEIRDYLQRAGFRVLWTRRRKPVKKSEFPFNKLLVEAQKL